MPCRKLPHKSIFVLVYTWCRHEMEAFFWSPMAGDLRRPHGLCDVTVMQPKTRETSIGIISILNMCQNDFYSCSISIVIVCRMLQNRCSVAPRKGEILCTNINVRRSHITYGAHPGQWKSEEKKTTKSWLHIPYTIVLSIQCLFLLIWCKL